MARRKLPLCLIDDRRRRRQKYDTSKETLKRKAAELGKLCDTAVALVVVGPDGEMETWPEDASQLCDILAKYESCPASARSKNEHGLPWLLAEHGIDEQQQHSHRVGAAPSAAIATGVDAGKLPGDPLEEKMVVSDPFDTMNRGLFSCNQPFVSYHEPYLENNNGGLSSWPSPVPRDYEGLQFTGGLLDNLPASCELNSVQPQCYSTYASAFDSAMLLRGCEAAAEFANIAAAVTANPAPSYVDANHLQTFAEIATLAYYLG